MLGIRLAFQSGGGGHRMLPNSFHAIIIEIASALTNATFSVWACAEEAGQMGRGDDWEARFAPPHSTVIGRNASPNSLMACAIHTPKGRDSASLFKPTLIAISQIVPALSNKSFAGFAALRRPAVPNAKDRPRPKLTCGSPRAISLHILSELLQRRVKIRSHIRDAAAHPTQFSMRLGGGIDTNWATGVSCSVIVEALAWQGYGSTPAALLELHQSAWRA